jgi:hypothetical protein
MGVLHAALRPRLALVDASLYQRFDSILFISGVASKSPYIGHCPAERLGYGPAVFNVRVLMFQRRDSARDDGLMLGQSLPENLAGETVLKNLHDSSFQCSSYGIAIVSPVRTGDRGIFRRWRCCPHFVN